MALQSPLMCLVKCDVTSDGDVTDLRNCVERSLETERVLWAVVNNAGVNFTGDVELTTVELFKWVADVNYMGVVRVTKSFLPLIRKCKGPPQDSVFQPSSNHKITLLFIAGRIVNISSVKGRIPAAFCAAYCSAKFAGELPLLFLSSYQI